MLDSKDLERFVDDFGDHAYGFAFSLCGNEPEARDLVQEAFVKLFDRAGQFDAAQSLESWFMTILKNLFLDGRRRWERKYGVPLDAPIGDGQLTVADAVADRRDEAILDKLERAECSKLVRRALGRLSPQLRATINLIDVNGLGYEEAAKVMDCPLNTVRSRISRARLELREKLLELEVTA